MNLIDACDQLEKEGLPIPVVGCDVCGSGTIWRKGQWFQCDNCGALSTAYGGRFTHTGVNAAWSTECQCARAKLDGLMGRPCQNQTACAV